MSDAFTLDARLTSDTVPLGDLPLSSVLLMDDARFPWLILVPRHNDLTELTDLSDEDSASLMGEIRLAGRVLQSLSRPDKINVGALGNVVAQLHIHVLGRFRSDPAWPGPVWGQGTREPYQAHARLHLVERARALFAEA